MSDWAPKRFWQLATVAEVEGGFTVLLDARSLRSPAKAAVVLPTRAMAEAMAEEWDAQEGRIDPDTMPITRAANSAIDKLGVQRAEVADMLAAYGATDLLCYRAERPLGLVTRQADLWDPLIDWAADDLQAPLAVTVGVVPVDQPQDSLSRLAVEVHALDPFRLAAFHDLVAISGSLVLALALVRGRLSPHEAWALSQLDESWQSEQWGLDEEAAETEALKQAAFLQAYRFWGLCG